MSDPDGVVSTSPDTTPGPAAGGAASVDEAPRRRGAWTRWALVAGVVVLAVVAWLASSDDAACEAIPGVRAGLCVTPAAERPVAPNSALPVLGDRDRTLSVDDVGDGVRVVNFWGSWCVPCRTEQPELNDVATAYADRGVAFLGVDVNEASETNGLRHEEALEIPYPSLWDPEYAYAGDFGVGGPRVMPTTVVLDEQGRVAVSIPGATTEVELSALLDEVLAGSAGS